MAKRCAMFGGVLLTTPNLGGAAIDPQSQNDERLDDYARKLILGMKNKNVKLKLRIFSTGFQIQNVCSQNGVNF